MKDAERLKPSLSQLRAADLAHLEREALAHAPQLYRLAARLLGNAAEAEDVLQEAFAKAISLLRIGAYRGECALPTWLYRVVTNAALDRLRSAKRAQAAHQRAENAATESASTSPEAAVALRELVEALSELPEDQRAALVLKEIHGLPAREVAQVLERSEGAIEQLLVRARQTLRRRFES
ncbi:MAG: RNA polymerase sigma factor [Myxococcaceae bacterium]|nr:RNA polymerase sigma factor [Myxococcaceae bacterium]